MKQNKVSIICAVYNGSKYINKTLESIYNQSYNNIELIIIDDCSTDDSFNKIKKFAENKNNVKLIKNNVNLGINASLNKAIDYSNGAWILLIGHDDTLPKNYIEQMSLLIDENVSFIHSSPILIDENDNVIKVFSENKRKMNISKKPLFYLSITNCICSIGCMINKKKLIEVGKFNTKYRNYGEWDLWIKLSNIGNVVYCKNVKPNYRRHTTNITNTFSNENIRLDLENYKQECRLKAYNSINMPIYIRICYKIILKLKNIRDKFRRKVS